MMPARLDSSRVGQSMVFFSILVLAPGLQAQAAELSTALSISPGFTDSPMVAAWSKSMISSRERNGCKTLAVRKSQLCNPSPRRGDDESKSRTNCGSCFPLNDWREVDFISVLSFRSPVPKGAAPKPKQFWTIAFAPSAQRCRMFSFLSREFCPGWPASSPGLFFWS